LNNYNVGDQIDLPIAHGEGCYHCSDDTLKLLEDTSSIALKYNSNPNGSIANIAGITNEKGNILGLMPHPERACDPLLGGIDGREIIQALLS